MLNPFRALRRTVTYSAAACSVVGLMAVSACNDKEVTAPVVTGAVATFVDPAVNFGALRTFAMPDTVIHLVPATGTPIAISRQYDHVILDRVRADLVARGYTVAPDPRNVAPDFVVLVGTTATENYQAWVSYPWYVDYGYYPGWGWYAPGFTSTWGIVYPWYPVVGVTAYSRGTVLVDLIPTLSVQPTGKTIRSAWAGAATALMNGTVTADVVTAAIDEMFTQSPYLRAQP